MRTRTSLLDKIAILLFFVLLTMASLCFGESAGTTTTTAIEHPVITAGPAHELVQN